MRFYCKYLNNSWQIRELIDIWFGYLGLITSYTFQFFFFSNLKYLGVIFWIIIVERGRLFAPRYLYFLLALHTDFEKKLLQRARLSDFQFFLLAKVTWFRLLRKIGVKISFWTLSTIIFWINLKKMVFPWSKGHFDHGKTIMDICNL